MLGMAGANIVASELSPEISPTIEVEGATPEWAFLKGLRLAGAGTLVTAGAANVSSARLRNPGNSTTIAVITQVQVRPVAVQGLQLQLGEIAVDIGAVLLTRVRDSRWNPSGGAGRNVLVLSSTNSGGGLIGGVLAQSVAAANELFTYDQGILLLPGDALDITGVINNSAIHLTLAWTERGLPDLEA